MTVDELKKRLSLPVIGAPMFLASGVDLVVAQCCAGIVGAFPALNARPATELDNWLTEIETRLDAFEKTGREQGDELAGIARAGAGGQAVLDIGDSLEAAQLDRDDARTVDPQAQRDHVLRLGVLIEVHAAQDDQQAFLELDHARPGFLGEQGIDDQRVEIVQLVRNPLARLGMAAVEMHPGEALIGRVRSGLVARYHRAAAVAVNGCRIENAGMLRHCGPPAVPGLRATGYARPAAGRGSRCHWL